MSWAFANADNTVVVRMNADGSMESRSVNDAEVGAEIAAADTPDPYVAPPAPVPSFLARDLLAQFTSADFTAIQTAISGSAALGLLWASLLAQGEAPIAIDSARFQAGWTALSAALGPTRATAIATALGIPAN